MGNDQSQRVAFTTLYNLLLIIKLNLANQRVRNNSFIVKSVIVGVFPSSMPEQMRLFLCSGTLVMSFIFSLTSEMELMAFNC